MTQPRTIYGPADVATELNLSRANVSNYLSDRYGDTGTPAPTFVTTDGRKFWDDKGLRAWRRWWKDRRGA